MRTFIIGSLFIVHMVLGSSKSPGSNNKAVATSNKDNNNNKSKGMITKEIAAAQDGKIQAFLNKVRNSAINQPKAKPKQEKATKKAARRQARNDARKQIVAAQAERGGDDDILSLSASFEASRRRRSVSHFSLSESEHYKDCSQPESSSTSSSSNENGTSSHRNHRKHHKKSCCGDKPKYTYRLRHCRIRAENISKANRSRSGSLSAEVELGPLDVSASASGSFERSRRSVTVLRICEDELARKNAACATRRRRRSSSSSSSSDSSFERVDYRKKIFYHSDSERSFSASISASLSISEDPIVVESPP